MTKRKRLLVIAVGLLFSTLVILFKGHTLSFAQENKKVPWEKTTEGSMVLEYAFHTCNLYRSNLRVFTVAFNNKEKGEESFVESVRFLVDDIDKRAKARTVSGEAFPIKGARLLYLSWEEKEDYAINPEHKPKTERDRNIVQTFLKYPDKSYTVVPLRDNECVNSKPGVLVEVRDGIRVPLRDNEYVNSKSECYDVAVKLFPRHDLGDDTESGFFKPTLIKGCINCHQYKKGRENLNVDDLGGVIVFSVCSQKE